MKICPVGAKLFHVDRQTDRQTDKTTMMELTVALCNFTKGLEVFHTDCEQCLRKILP